MCVCMFVIRAIAWCIRWPVCVCVISSGVCAGGLGATVCRR